METIRTRFAPSPTGYLHVGGLRTALFNYLLARNLDGKFILRIEDTDQARYVQGAMEKLLSSLKSMGLSYDEGPDAAGTYGPYMQSERLDIYKKYVQQLLDSGDAYYCFCTPETLTAMRERQIAEGMQPGYDGTWRERSETEIQKQLDQGTPHVIRLKMPQEGETVFHDLIRGEVRVQNPLVDDQVLMKSDGFPTYHLANVVDDHLMDITHVVRGEEWLLSVPKHLHLYRCLGWEPPEMAHLSLLLNPDRSKLSKRQGDVAVEDFLEKGYLPEALLNFCALLGWNPGTDEEFFTLEALIEQFSLEKVNKSGAVFNIEKLNWMNSNYIRNLPEERLIPFLVPYLESAGADISDSERTGKIVLAVYKNIHRGDEIFQAAAVFYRDILEIQEPDALEALKSPEAPKVLKMLLEKIETVDILDMTVFKKIMKDVQKASGVKGPKLWKPVRVALTGKLAGPDLPIVIEIFGKEKAAHFISQALNQYTE